MGARRGDDTGEGVSANEHLSARIRELGDWRGETLAWVRQQLHDAVPDVVEAWKWRGTPVWEHHGGICTGETYQQVVKLTFFRGASLPDPHGLFNASLDGGTRRAIDLREGERLDGPAFRALLQAAAAANVAARPRKG